MAYLDQDEYFLVWLAEPLPDVPVASYLQLTATAGWPATDVSDPEPAWGYIIRDWFGPFLLGPASRWARGRC